MDQSKGFHLVISMISQIFLPKSYKFLATCQDSGPFAFDFLLGSTEVYEVLDDKNKNFVSLGGNKATPLTYKYVDDGWTKFIIKFYAVNRYACDDYINTKKYCDEYSNAAVYEIWVDGVKTYYSFFEKSLGNAFDTTFVVKCKKDQTTNFKFRIIPDEQNMDPCRPKNYHFLGGKDIVYSSITAQFIPDAIIQTNNQPIIVKEDITLKKNRRYLVYALYAKTLQLNLDEEDQFQVGDWIEIKNMDLGNFQINSGANIDILMNGLITRVKNGYIRSKKRGDFLRLECMETSPRIIFSDTCTSGTFIII